MKKLLLIFAIGCFFISNATAQSTEDQEKFNTAKLHLANHKIDRALPILEELWYKDQENANLNYLLGLCYVKEGVKIGQAVELLETASNLYSTDYDAGSNKERRAPEYVYYYLTIAYSLDGQCSSALTSLNQFYSIYSYEDEYYLIDGQKWVRECNLMKKEQERSEQLMALDKRLEEQDATEEVAMNGEIPEEPIVEEVVEEVVVEEAPTPAPQIKERLNRYKANENKTISTKSIDYTTIASLYGVQVGAFLEPKFTREFERLKNVEVYVDKNGVFRYVIGRFNYRGQAETLLGHIKEAGYKDAFIVDVNDDIKYSEEVVTVGDESIKWQIAGKVDFKVQIGAFRQIIPEQIALTYLQVDGIKEFKQQELTILTVGSFDSYDKAALQKEALRGKGIEDAFVVAFNYNRKIPLDEASKHLGQPVPATGEVITPNSKKKRK